MILLKLPPPTPRISIVAISDDGTAEPIPRLLHLALGPEQARHGDDDGGRVVGLLECVDRAGLACWSRFAPNRVRVEETRGGEGLQCCGRVRRALVAERRAPQKSTIERSPRASIPLAAPLPSRSSTLTLSNQISSLLPFNPLAFSSNALALIRTPTSSSNRELINHSGTDCGHFFTPTARASRASLVLGGDWARSSWA